MKFVKIQIQFVIYVNKLVCTQNNQTHICAQPEKIESLLHSAFYPGSFPFVHGGLSGIASAIFFYVIKSHAFFDGNKRTALICSVSFLEFNGFTIQCPKTDFANLAEKCASGKIEIDVLKKWFRNHTVRQTG